MKKSFLLLTISAIALQLTAATSVYKVELLRDSLVDGHLLKPGTYEISIKDTSEITLKHGKHALDVPAREETSASKYEETELLYQNEKTLEGIRLGGTNLELSFETPAGDGSAQGR